MSKAKTGGKQVRKPRVNATKDEMTSSKAQKREEFIRENKAVRLLGEIVTWNSGAEGHSHADIVQSLKDCDLNHEVARELLPRHAFTRAAKKLTENRVIDPVNQDNDEIKFQFTKRFMEENEWKYSTECYLTLNKKTGRISCPSNPELETAAQDALDKAMEQRTSADVTKMIQKLFDAEADLFPIRDQGGVYFVPQQYEAFVAKIEKFVTRLGGRVSRFPVPADTQQGDKSVQDAIINGLSMVIHDHEEAVEGFGLDTRHDTLERAAEKIKATRVKIEAYAHYLSERKAELEAAVEEANNKLKERVKSLTEERSKMPAVTTDGGGTRAYIFGFSVTAVIRWMGLNNWTFKQIKKTVDHFVGVGKISEATIRAQMLGGRNIPKMTKDDKGWRGDAPDLPPHQVAELVKARDAEVIEQESPEETEQAERNESVVPA